MTDFARRTAQAVWLLAKRPVVAWGEGDGALFALQLALQAPDLVAAAVLDRGATAIAATASPAFAGRCRALADDVRQCGTAALAASAFAGVEDGTGPGFPAARLAEVIEALGRCGSKLADARGLAVPVLVSAASDDLPALRAAMALLRSAPPGMVEVVAVEPGSDRVRTAETLIRRAPLRDTGAPRRARAIGRRLRVALAVGLAALVLSPAAWLLPMVAAGGQQSAGTPVLLDPGASARLAVWPRLDGSHPSVDLVMGSREPGPTARTPRATVTPGTGPAEQEAGRPAPAPRTLGTEYLERQPAAAPSTPAPAAASSPGLTQTPSTATPVPRLPGPAAATPPAVVPREPTVPAPGRPLPTGHTCDGAFARPSPAADAFDAVSRAVLPRLTSDGEFDSCAAGRP